jgi:hypothetical protein
MFNITQAFAPWRLELHSNDEALRLFLHIPQGIRCLSFRTSLKMKLSFVELPNFLQ